MALTVKRVTRLMSSGTPGMHSDKGGTRGLYLSIASRTAASWGLRYQIAGRARFLGLGSAKDFSLMEARERATKARQQLADGDDPLEMRKAERAAKALAKAKTMTFKQCADAYIAANSATWKNAKHGGQWITTLQTYVHPVIGSLPVAEIDTGLVLKCIEPIWQDKTETASRIRGRIEAILDWATVRKYRSGDNPARWISHLKHALPAKTKLAKVAPHAALPYADVPTFVVELRQREGIAARALEFAILTAARTGEVLGAQWAEIDLGAALWTIPADRMKAGAEHKVPLSKRAVELLRALPREDGNSHVFIGMHQGTGLRGKAMTSVLRRMGRTDITIHGFRSSFRDWASETTNFPNHVAEMALAHTIKNKTEAAYRRGDLLEKRRKLMEAWSTFATSPPAASRKGVVLPIRKTPA